MYADYYRPPQVLHQQGHGLGSLFSKIALPALRRLAPVAKKIVKRHGKKLVRTSIKAAGAAIKNKGNRKKAAGNVFRDALVAELSRPHGRTGGKKKGRKGKKGRKAKGRAFSPGQRHLYVKPRMRSH